ncbi:MAG: hypothetical protein LBT75_05655, partial [Bacilli bacterium]|nr:hypothetical protein [Bacilli bacterium]
MKMKNIFRWTLFVLLAMMLCVVLSLNYRNIKAASTHISTTIDNSTNVTWGTDSLNPNTRNILVNLNLDESYGATIVKVNIPFEFGVISYTDTSTAITGDKINSVNIVNATAVGNNTVLTYNMKEMTGTVGLYITINPQEPWLLPNESFIVSSDITLNGTTIETADDLNIDITNGAWVKDFELSIKTNDDLHPNTVHPGQVVELMYHISQNANVAGQIHETNKKHVIYVDKKIDLYDNNDPNISIDKTNPAYNKITIIDESTQFLIYTTAKAIKVKIADDALIGSTLASTEQSYSEWLQAGKTTLRINGNLPGIVVEDYQSNIYSRIYYRATKIGTYNQYLFNYEMRNTTGGDLSNFKGKIILPDGVHVRGFALNEITELNYPITFNYKLHDGTTGSLNVTNVMVHPSDLGISDHTNWIEELEYVIPDLPVLAGIMNPDYDPVYYHTKLAAFGDIATHYQDGTIIRNLDNVNIQVSYQADEISAAHESNHDYVLTYKLLEINTQSTNNAMIHMDNYQGQYTYGDEFYVYPYLDSNPYEGGDYTNTYINPDFYIRIPAQFTPDVAGYKAAILATGKTPDITSRIDGAGATIIHIKYSGSPGDSSYAALDTFDDDINLINNTPDALSIFNNQVIPKLKITVKNGITERKYSFLSDDNIVGMTLAPKSYPSNEYVYDRMAKSVNGSNSTDYIDIYDINGDNSTSDHLVRMFGYIDSPINNINIVTPIIYTIFGDAKSSIDSTWLDFDPANVLTTSSNYLPNSSGDYRTTLFNGTAYDYTDGVIYIPIPKTGDSNGSQWTPILNGAPLIKDKDGNTIAGVCIEYSTQTNPSTNELTGGSDTGYSTTLPALNAVSMVKIKVPLIEAKNSAIVTLPLKAPTTYLKTDINKLAYINAKTVVKNNNNILVSDLNTKLSGLRLSSIDISGVVFKDNNYNSVNDDAAYVNGVTVELLDSTNNVIDTTTTDSAGKYTLVSNADGSTSSNFKVRFTKPNNMIGANKDSGTDDSIDSDMSYSDFTTDNISLLDTDILNVDAGFGDDALVSATPITHNVKIGNSGTTNYTITNGTFDTANVTDLTVASKSNGTNSISFTGLKTGSTSATLS